MKVNNYEYSELLAHIDLMFRKNENIKISSREATLLIELGIENDDLEVLKLLISKDVDIEETILKTLPYIGPEKYFLISDHLLKKDDFNWSLTDCFLCDIVKSRSSDINMFKYAVRILMGNYIEEKDENNVPLLFLICQHKRNDFMYFLMTNFKIDYFQKYNGKTLLNHIEKKLNPELYFKAKNSLI